MRVLVVHSHFRPGGVRRVIETALPYLVRDERSRVRSVVLWGGEAPEVAWREALAGALRPVELGIVVRRELGYAAEQRASPSRVRAIVREDIARWANDPEPLVVWLHNPGLGRNLRVAKEWARAGREAGVRVVFHHHDWWFDHRWQRWPELRRSGARSVGDVARAVLADAPGVRHAGINAADATVLRAHFGARAAWIPNPVEEPRPVDQERAEAARRWLADRVGVRGPAWVLPCRLLRRKNVAEALLVTRWLRPKATLVTTGGVSSADEREYAEALGAAVRKHRWPCRLGVLGSGVGRVPDVAALLAAGEMVLLTSLMEGFGLPYLESVAARRPLVARALPNVVPDLTRFGFRFSRLYEEAWVAAELFDWRAERRRQERRFRRWRSEVPAGWRRWVGIPWVLREEARPRAVPFSRLTLAAQLEVLRADSDESWRASVEFNAGWAAWRKAAGRGGPRPGRWPAAARDWVGGEAFARRWVGLVRRRPRASEQERASERAQEALLRGRLASEHLYPLLWSPEP